MTGESHYGVAKTGTPAFAIRGIVEGFYGTPWTHGQRLDMIEFIAARGMNTFVYSPKDDPLVRRDWRVPYTGIELARLSELADACARHGVEFVYCLSPGLSIEYSSRDDCDALCAKFESIFRLGIRFFGLLFDDIPSELQHSADRERFPDLVSAHAHVTGDVFTALRAIDPVNKLIVCPTVYWGYGDEDYVVRLGQSIDPRIEFFWTGRAICAATIDLSDAAVVARSIARPVTYWDNYPVNDVAMGGELHIGPYRGRDRHLYRFARGVIANGMELVEASKIAFATISDYLWAPESYDPEQSWRVALREVVGNDVDSALFEVFAENVRSSCLSAEDAARVSSALEQFVFGVQRGAASAAAAELSAFADGLLDVAQRLLSDAFSNQALMSEARPWVETFELGARAVKRLAELYAGSELSELSEQERDELATLSDELRATGRRVFGDAVVMTLSDCAAEPPGTRS
ncbi:MAG: protein O-GlcNAcase [Lacisediminihabitans sp.]